MTAYLESMKNATYGGPAPAETPKTVIAALGPRMLEVAAKHADGAHPYNVTSVHTAEARRILGADKLLCPEQKVLLETDPVTARGIGRGFLESYLRLPNYRNHFLRMGFTEQDMEYGGSDRLIDGIIACEAMRIRFARAFKRIGMQAPIKCAFKAFRETGTPWPDKMSGSSSF